MSREKVTKFREQVSALTREELAQLENEISARRTREWIGEENFSDAAESFGRKPSCPECGSGECIAHGMTKSGERRYLCKKCGKTFTLMSRSIFASAKSRLRQYCTALRLMSYNVPLDVVADVVGVHHNTALLWRRKAFATVDGWQSKVILRDRIWIDEIYVSDYSMPRNHFGPNVRGLSKRKCCILLAIDCHRSMIAAYIGHGKPKAGWILKALRGHVRPGATVVHDGLESYEGILKELGLESETHKSKRNDEATLKAMLMINSFCAWMRRYLDRFTGMRTKWLQSYLNWFVYVFRVKDQKEKWPKDERIVRHLLLSEAVFTRRSH